MADIGELDYNSPLPELGSGSHGLSTNQTIMVCALVVGTLMLLIGAVTTFMLLFECRDGRIRRRKGAATSKTRQQRSRGVTLPPSKEMQLRAILSGRVVERPTCSQLPTLVSKEPASKDRPSRSRSRVKPLSLQPSPFRPGVLPPHQEDASEDQTVNDNPIYGTPGQHSERTQPYSPHLTGWATPALDSQPDWATPMRIKVNARVPRALTFNAMPVATVAAAAVTHTQPDRPSPRMRRATSMPANHGAGYTGSVPNERNTIDIASGSRGLSAIRLSDGSVLSRMQSPASTPKERWLLPETSSADAATVATLRSTAFAASAAPLPTSISQRRQQRTRSNLGLSEGDHVPAQLTGSPISDARSDSLDLDTDILSRKLSNTSVTAPDRARIAPDTAQEDFNTLPHVTVELDASPPSAATPASAQHSFVLDGDVRVPPATSPTLSGLQRPETAATSPGHAPVEDADALGSWQSPGCESARIVPSSSLRSVVLKGLPSRSISSREQSHTAAQLPFIPRPSGDIAAAAAASSRYSQRNHLATVSKTKSSANSTPNAGQTGAFTSGPVSDPAPAPVERGDAAECTLLTTRAPAGVGPRAPLSAPGPAHTHPSVEQQAPSASHAPVGSTLGPRGKLGTLFGTNPFGPAGEHTVSARKHATLDSHAAPLAPNGGSATAPLAQECSEEDVSLPMPPAPHA